MNKQPALPAPLHRLVRAPSPPVHSAGFGIFSCLPVFWTLPTNFLSDAAAAGSIAAINSIGNFAGFADLVEADSVRHDVPPLDFPESLKASTK
jgi:hypothetical protein